MAIKLSAPTNLRCTKSTLTSLTLAWNAVTGAKNYKFWCYKKSSPSTGTQGSVTGTTKTITGLTRNTTYVFSVLANPTDTTNYTSSNQTGITASTLKSVQLAAPTGLTATNIKSTDATLHWNNVENATDYKVQYKAAGDTVWTETYTD